MTATAIIRPNRLLDVRKVGQEGFGYANLEVGAKVNPASVFELESISKEFTAAAVMKLVEEHKLALEDSIRKYIDIDVGPYVITVKHLLEHASGLASFTEFPEARGGRHGGPTVVSPDDVFRALEKRPLLFEPGTRYSYTNTGYFLLAKIVEKVTGERFDEYVKREVIARAGLKETFYCDGERITPQRATPYKLVNARTFANISPRDRHLQVGIANICASARDLVAWSATLRGGKVLSRQSYDLMTHPGAGPDYGLGFQLGNLARPAAATKAGLRPHPPGAEPPDPQDAAGTC